MKHNSLTNCMLLLLFVALLVLPGCRRYYYWIRDVFDQGEKLDTYTCLVRQYWRAEHVYDQFSPLAHFDVIWLSNEVRIAYAQTHAAKYCFNQERYLALQARQLEENKHYITFYILSAVTPFYGSDDLADINTEWAVLLIINGACYRPIEIKEIELSPEYVLFFGPAYTRFKRSYQVRFDAHDVNNIPLLRGGTPSLCLCFNRGDRRVCVQWCLDSAGNVIREISEDRNLLACPIHCPIKM